MKKWLLTHRKLVTVFLIAVTVVVTVVVTGMVWHYGKTELEFIELLYYGFQISSAVFVISGVVIAIWQYYISCVDSKRNIDVICVQKAVDLSEYYKDNILSYMAPIRYILKESGISAITDKVDVAQIKYFDEKELRGFLTEEDISDLKTLQQSDKFYAVVLKADMIYGLGLDEKLISSYNKESEKSTDLDVMSVILGKLITRVLNNMEYFALHFTHNVADESVVYKSLHQTYISFVQMLYYNIAIKNPLSTTKYFTNIIELYEVWNSRALNDEEMFVNGVRNLSNKGTVVDSE